MIWKKNKEPKVVTKEDPCTDFATEYPGIYECIKKIVEKHCHCEDTKIIKHLTEWHISQMNCCSESFTMKEIKFPKDESDTKGIRKAKECLVFYECYPLTFHEVILSCNLVNDLSRKLERIRFYNCRILTKEESEKKQLMGFIDGIKNIFKKSKEEE